MGKQVLGRLLLGGGLIVGLACSASQAEIIKRVNPDGSNTFIVPEKVPAGDRSGPCGVNPADVPTLDGAREAYDQTLQRLAADPGNIACRQQLTHLGRMMRRPETAVAHDLNASALGAPPLLAPGGMPPGAGAPQYQ
jgi:hypothetical protein